MDKEMICQICQQEKKQEDFLNANTVCYKCVYQQKTLKIKKKNQFNSCRMCGERCEENRWVYCSNECALLGELEQKKNHWTAKIRSVKNYSRKDCNVGSAIRIKSKSTSLDDF